MATPLRDLNKPYDHSFQRFAETDPRGMLYLFEGLPLNAAYRIRRLAREITGPPLQIDYAYQVTRGGQTRIHHFEAFAYARHFNPEKVTWYATFLAGKYREPVDTTVVLFHPKGGAARIPKQYRIPLDSPRIVYKFRVVKLWEMDPHAVMRMDRASLLPWVPLMRADENTVVEAARRVVATRNRELRSRFCVLSTLRYNREQFAEVLGRLERMIPLELLEQSWLVKEVTAKARAKARKQGWAEGRTEGLEKGLEEGRQEGLEKGLEKGRADEARRAAKLYLQHRFPSLTKLPEIDHIQDIDILESLITSLYKASTVRAARAAIRRHSSN